MTDREEIILRNIDKISDKCIEYLESNYSVIPNIGLFNVDLIVLAFLMEHLLTERGFKGERMQSLLNFYENHFISNRFVSSRKNGDYLLGNDEIYLNNVSACMKFEEMNYNDKRKYFIHTLSNISVDLNKFIKGIRKHDQASKIHYPVLALVSIYANPMFCNDTNLIDYDESLKNISLEIKNSNIDFNVFLITFSNMWIKIISKRIDHGQLFLDEIELNFPQNLTKNKDTDLRELRQVKEVKPSRTIYYSKFKTSGLFYQQGENTFNLYVNDTISITTPDLTTRYYDIESLYEDRNDSIFIIRSQDNGKIGEFRLKPMGKAELSFSGKTILKLKI